MGWQIHVTLWAFSVLAYAFISLVAVAAMKQAFITGLKEVIVYYFEQKVKWIEQLEAKFGKGSGSRFGVS